MKPPFGYYGGKQRIASKIIPFIPKHTVYVEPFCGSATILFKKPWPNVTNNNHYREYINDTNGLVFNFFDVLSRRGNELADRLAVYPMLEEHHSITKNICKSSTGADELELAIAFFVNVQQSFSNNLNSGWRRGVYGRNEQATWAKIKNLYDYVERMSSVGVSCQDAPKYIRQFDSPQTFFYCDPPYPETDQGHYKGYTQENFNNLVNTLSACQGSAIISCYNQDDRFNPYIWTKAEFSTTCSAKNRVGYDRSKKKDESDQNRKRTEVIYIKQSSQPREEIQKLYDSGKFDCFEGRLGELVLNTKKER